MSRTFRTPLICSNKHGLSYAHGRTFRMPLHVSRADGIGRCVYSKEQAKECGARDGTKAYRDYDTRRPLWFAGKQMCHQAERVGEAELLRREVEAALSEGQGDGVPYKVGTTTVLFRRSDSRRWKPLGRLLRAEGLAGMPRAEDYPQHLRQHPGCITFEEATGLYPREAHWDLFESLREQYEFAEWVAFDATTAMMEYIELLAKQEKEDEDEMDPDLPLTWMMYGEPEGEHQRIHSLEFV